MAMAVFSHPQLLLLIPAAIAIMFLAIRKDFVKLKGDRWAFYQKVKIRRRLAIFALRSVVVACLLAALAQPVALRQELSSGDPSLTILVDSSRSFDLFDRSVVDKIKEELEGEMPVSIRQIATHDGSAIGDELLATILGSDNLLLVSDGRVTGGRSLGDVMVVASSINSTINSLYLEPVKTDLALKVEGPRITTVGIDNEFLVRVDETKPQDSLPVGYNVVVTIDGEKVVDETSSGTNAFKFSRKLDEGYHTIVAQLNAADFIQDNNMFYRTVKVEKKPKVLLISKKSSPLEGLFSPLYDLSTAASMSGVDLSGYSAVALNDIPADETDSNKLSSFIDDGNGIVVIGGRSSYDRGSYKGTFFENLLPVNVGSGEEASKKFVNVVLLIDISGSTGEGFSTTSSATVEEVEKALAIGLVSDLRPEDRVGIVAFNVEPHTVAELGRLSANRNDLLSRIPRLVYTGSTLVSEGLRGARQMLAGIDGSKNIVLLSDGKSGSMGEDLVAARYAAEQGMKVYAVGVGEGTNSEHMQAIAKAGNGVYFEPTEAQQLRIIFGSAEAAPTDRMKLEKLNNNHFITRNVKLNARLAGFNQVVPKPNADVLVATAENRPVITVWRFGLGRIVSLTTDDGTGWAAELLNRENSVLVTRTMNWAIGDLGRNKKFDVTARDTFLGNEFEVEVTADSMPSDARMAFSKVGERLYSSQLEPEKTGWYSFFDATAAANYPLELLNTGYDPDLAVLVQVTGGQTFRPEQTDEILQKVKDDSKRLVTRQKSLAWIPLMIALVVFLLDIAVRKLWEGAENRAT
ncbi:VWA domain-containing protein [Candidatus Woesearchaeota archaeon]|nr:VWA domain-containing protein [Candidatus Woesearchaeota archaeon]